MALTIETTFNPDTIGDVPSDASAAPTTITFAGGQFAVPVSMDIADSLVEAGTTGATFDNCVVEFDGYVQNTLVPNILGLDTTGNNYNCIAELRTVQRGNSVDKYTNQPKFYMTGIATIELV